MAEALMWKSRRTLVGRPPRAYGGGFGHAGRTHVEGFIGVLTCPEGSYTGIGSTDALALRSAERMRAAILRRSRTHRLGRAHPEPRSAS